MKTEELAKELGVSLRTTKSIIAALEKRWKTRASRRKEIWPLGGKRTMKTHCGVDCYKECDKLSECGGCEKREKKVIIKNGQQGDLENK